MFSLSLSLSPLPDCALGSSSPRLPNPLLPPPPLLFSNSGLLNHAMPKMNYVSARPKKEMFSFAPYARSCGAQYAHSLARLLRVLVELPLNLTHFPTLASPLSLLSALSFFPEKNKAWTCSTTNDDMRTELRSNFWTLCICVQIAKLFYYLSSLSVLFSRQASLLSLSLCFHPFSGEK